MSCVHKDFPPPRMDENGILHVWRDSELDNYDGYTGPICFQEMVIIHLKNGKCHREDGPAIELYGQTGGMLVVDLWITPGYCQNGFFLNDEKTESGIGYCFEEQKL